MGIGDGFVPELVDLRAVDRIERVSTEDANAEAARIRRDHGYCVGRSAGANMVAARRLLDRGVEVATVWPDCSDRYVSLGLDPPSPRDTRCPLQPLCTERSHGMLRANDDRFAGHPSASRRGIPPPRARTSQRARSPEDIA
jgi:hypothetical protein